MKNELTVMSKDKAVIKGWVKEIIDLYGEMRKGWTTMLEDAIQIGDLLFKCKKQVAHGEWEQFVRINMPFSLASAGNYMRSYERQKELKSLSDSDLIDGGWQDALHKLGEKAQQKPGVVTTYSSGRAREAIPPTVGRADLFPEGPSVTPRQVIEPEVMPEPEVSLESEKYSVKDEGINFDDEWWLNAVTRIRDTALVRAGSVISCEDPIAKHRGTHDEPIQLIQEPWKHYTHVRITVELIKEVK